MANDFDASIKLLYPVDKNTFSTIDVLEPADEYDVVANVEIGRDLNQFATEHILRVAIVNLSTAEQVAVTEVREPLTPQDNSQRQQEMRAGFPALQTPGAGDVLQAVASYRVVAGANSDVSTAQSVTFAVGG